jgi:hypothetical protein
LSQSNIGIIFTSDNLILGRFGTDRAPVKCPREMKKFKNAKSGNPSSDAIWPEERLAKQVAL